MQTRWFCHDCQREWVYSVEKTINEAGQAVCPACLSPAIMQIRYQPAFPGGDIPRDGPLVPPPTPIVVPEQRTGPLSLVPRSEERA